MLHALILDDLKMRSDGFQNLISERYMSSKIQTCDNEQLFVSRVASFSGDILIYCTSKFHSESKEILESIVQFGLSGRSIIITNKISGWVITTLKTSGVYGYLVMQDNSNQILLDAIKNVVEGKPYYCQKVCQAIVDSHTLPPTFKLTARELQIALLISKDLSSSEIADKLCLSSYTISSYRKNILKKMNVKTSGGLVRRLSEFDLF